MSAVSGRPTGAAHSTRTVLVAGATALAIAVLGDVLDTAANTTSLLAASSGGVILFIAEQLKKRGQSRAETIKQIAVHGVAKSPAIVIGSIVFALLFAENLLGFVVGALIGSVLSVVGVDDQAALDSVIGLSSLVVGPVMLAVTYFVAERAWHFLERRKMLIVVSGVLIARSISVAITLLVLPVGSSSESLLLYAFAALAFTVVLVAVAMLGCARARPVHREFIASRLFRKLLPADQAELLQALESAAVQRGGEGSARSTR